MIYESASLSRMLQFFICCNLERDGKRFLVFAEDCLDQVLNIEVTGQSSLVSTLTREKVVFGESVSE